MESKRLDSAAQAAGISLSYINAHGKLILLTLAGVS